MRKATLRELKEWAAMPVAPKERNSRRGIYELAKCGYVTVMFDGKLPTPYVTPTLMGRSKLKELGLYMAGLTTL